MRWLSSLLIIPVIVMAGCSSQSGDTLTAASTSPTSTEAVDDSAQGAADDQPETDTPTDNDDDTDNSDGDDDGDAEPETLAELLGGRANLIRGQGGGIPGGGQNFDETAALEQARQIEQEIRACMVAQGFEYTPEEPSLDPRAALFVGRQQVGEGLTAEEYAAEHGFGVTTSFEQLLDGGLAALGIASDEDDPNAEMLAAMSQSEADAWETTLNGVRPERDAEGRIIDPETGEPLAQGQGRRGAEPGGCRAQAQNTVRGDVEALQQLSDEFDELATRISADPRLLEIQTQWSRCMAEEGFDYETAAELQAELRAEFQPIARQLFRSLLGPGATNASTSPSLTEDQRAEIDALNEKERKLAVANHACGGNDTEEVQAIRARYEGEFIETNRDVLEAALGN